MDYSWGLVPTLQAYKEMSPEGGQRGHKSQWVLSMSSRHILL